MKDLGEQLRSGKVGKFNGSQLGINKSGKGDFPRFTYQCDEKYKEGYDRIFGKKNKK